jgi:hypothetical protein
MKGKEERETLLPRFCYPLFPNFPFSLKTNIRKSLKYNGCKEGVTILGVKKLGLYFVCADPYPYLFLFSLCISKFCSLPKCTTGAAGFIYSYFADKKKEERRERKRERE